MQVYRKLEEDELKALRAYAEEHGKLWKNALREDWYFARAHGERGSILHGLRNDPRWGHEGLSAFKFPH